MIYTENGGHTCTAILVKVKMYLMNLLGHWKELIKDKSGIIKNWDEPWSLFEHFSEDSEDTDSPEPGLLIALRRGWSMGREKKLSADLRDPLQLDWPSPGFTENWKNNLMPESHYAPYLWGDLLRHENPREGIADYFFRFYSLSKRNEVKNSVSFDTFYCKLNPYTLGAGETVTFAVLEKETALIPATVPKIPFISLSAQSDQQEETFLWRSTDETIKLRDNFIGYSYRVKGVKGMKEGEGEVLRYNAQTRQITRSKDTFFKEPNSVTMYYQELGDGDEFSPQNAQRVYQVTDNFHAHFHDARRMKYATTSILEENLVRRDQTDVLPGIGWEINWLMLGDSMCDRVILNDFNFRAHVSSSQHGSGNNIKTPEPKKNIRTLSPLHLESAGQALRTPDFDLSHCADELSYGVNTFKFPHGKLYQSGRSEEGYLSKRFPDVYGLPASFDAENFERNIREFNREEDPDQRANLLGFSNNGKDPMDYIIVENPNIDNQIVPRADSSKLSVGFFNRTNYNSNQYSNIKPSTEGVLFDVPMSSPLSLFQYRHANLNNYLHGPNYALGNAYATTQVARHRSWGRVQLVVKKPHSKGGMNSVKKNLEVRDEYLAQVVNKNPKKQPDDLYKDITYFGHKEIANWDYPGFDMRGDENIDRDQGFADWRAKGANQSNHQNTTVDHSYYLNRSLLDGFFLSGMDSDHCVNEGSLPLGEHYRPFIFNASSTSTSLDRDSTKEAKGNHRLMGYVRKYPNGNWKTSRTVYNINNSK